jgi:hypothetical protein
MGLDRGRILTSVLLLNFHVSSSCGHHGSVDQWISGSVDQCIVWCTTCLTTIIYQPLHQDDRHHPTHMILLYKPLDAHLDMHIWTTNTSARKCQIHTSCPCHTLTWQSCSTTACKKKKYTRWERTKAPFSDRTLCTVYTAHCTLLYRKCSVNHFLKSLLPNSKPKRASQGQLRGSNYPCFGPKTSDRRT